MGDPAIGANRPYELGVGRPPARRTWKDRLRALLVGASGQRMLASGSDVARLPDALVQTRQRLFGIEATLALTACGRTPRERIVFRSQYGEDSLIWDLLGGQTEGLYVECGAFDGLTYSVTSGFDAMGWDGLLVEAIPERFAECARNRPHAVVRHAALGGPGRPPTAEFVHVADVEGGMLSHGVLSEGATTPQHERRTAAHAGRIVTVPATTMDAILEQHFPGRRLDVAVIDVEGGEIELLRGFTLAKWKPRVLLIEDNSRLDDTPLARAMAAEPYVQIGWLNVNRVYVHHDERAILDRVG